MSDVTRLFDAAAAGDRKAAADLLPLVYDELRTLAVARMTEARADELRPVTARATSALDAALARLVEIMGDPAVHPGTRVRAAVAVFDVTLKLRNECYVASRLASIEAALDEAGIASPGPPLPAGVNYDTPAA